MKLFLTQRHDIVLNSPPDRVGSLCLAVGLAARDAPPPSPG